MNSYNVLLQYIFPAIAGFLSYALIFLPRKGTLRANRIYLTCLFYVSAVTALCLFYFCLYTREIFLKASSVNGIFRILDYVLYLLIPFFWLELEFGLIYRKEVPLRNNTAPENAAPDAVHSSDRFMVHFFRIWTAGWIIFLFLYLYLAAFQMDSGYYIANPKYASFYHRLETMFSVLTSVGLCLFWLHGRRRFPSKLVRVYALLTTLAQCAYCSYTVWDTRHIGNIPYITWRKEPIDITGWFLLAMNLLTLVFLYNCFELDNSPQDIPDVPEPGAETVESKPDSMEPSPAPMESAPELMSDEARIELLASRFDLTNREKEIAGLVTQGESNQKIADTLYISLNTVKSHIKNIFRKCGVHSRVELVHLISSAARGEENAPAEDSPAED